MVRINELIKMYDLVLAPKDQGFYVRGMANAQKDGAVEEIRGLKDEIKAELIRRRDDAKAAELAAANAKAAKLDANVPGLAELRKTQQEWAAYYRKYRYAVDSGSSRVPAKPQISTVDEVSAKYPVAAAYIKAEEYSMASNDRKATAGRKAMERLERGDDFREVLAEMDRWADDIDPWQ